ncbi:MAG TPA: heme-binding protein, partial [Cyclobacteriaceae bacterium]|nr:heme-binding protein [Cyclobacteriaceae bacterium]
MFALFATASCNKPAPKEPPLIVREGAKQGALKAEEIRKNTAVQLADGLTIRVWATDSLAPDPIAMSIDDKGRVYLTRTNRQKNSEFDIRGHRDWMTPSIALQTVEDRRAFLHQTFAPERSEENKWLPDLNNDGIHDWHDLAVEKDEVWKIEDQDGDGIADISTRILNDFHDEVSDVAGALLVREEDVFVGIGPDMWRLKDTDGDGVLDEKESISHGYAVHIGFSGHGMSGAIEGPDGKIYWGIGDIGANLVDKEGKKYEYPNEGVIVRSNPDGSDFEVVASGLRNTHEFVFDEYGNIITSDNDGDHPGESERLVHIVEGHDAGWRSNWQYGKYTDPKNNTYKVWMDEKLYVPRWEGQAAYIIPPIVNYHNGPTGMAYNPGTALGSVWKNKFFLVEFVGNPSRSHIWSFGLKPKGASFDLDNEVDVLSGILPTGIKFGNDGALYVADWINGWNTKNYGRVWKLDVSEDRDDLKAAREETKRLIELSYKEQTEEELFNLLQYGDMRVRQKAQFELVKRGEKGIEVFKKAIAQTD